MKRNIRNSNIKRKRYGFRARMKTRSGRKIVNARRRLRGTFPWRSAEDLRRRARLPAPRRPIGFNWSRIGPIGHNGHR